MEFVLLYASYLTYRFGDMWKILFLTNILMRFHANFSVKVIVVGVEKFKENILRILF